MNQRGELSVQSEEFLFFEINEKKETSPFTI